MPVGSRPPGAHIEDLDRGGDTALYAAVADPGNLILVQWLIATHGADVNGRTSDGRMPLHEAATPAIIRALLERGADPTLLHEDGWNALMWQTFAGDIGSVACLLEDSPRVIASIDAVATLLYMSPAAAAAATAAAVANAW